MTTKTSFLRKLSAAALATVFAHNAWAAVGDDYTWGNLSSEESAGWYFTKQSGTATLNLSAKDEMVSGSTVIAVKSVKFCTPSTDMSWPNTISLNGTTSSAKTTEDMEETLVRSNITFAKFTTYTFNTPALVCVGQNVSLVTSGGIRLAAIHTDGPISMGLSGQWNGYNCFCEVVGTWSEEAIKVAQIGDNKYSTLGDALDAAKSLTDDPTITLLMSVAGPVEIPDNVTLSMALDKRITSGAITGGGTLKLDNGGTGVSKTFNDWFAGVTLSDFAGTIDISNGRFEVNNASRTSLSTTATLKTSNRGKIYLGGNSGAWETKFVLSGTSWSGDGSYKMGPTCLRIDAGSSLAEASEITIVADGANVPSIGVYNTDAVIKAQIKGTGGIKIRSHNNQNFIIPVSSFEGLSGDINLVDAGVTLALTVENGEAELSNAVVGAGKIKKSGEGVLVLNSYTASGAITLEAGKIKSISALDVQAAEGLELKTETEDGYNVYSINRLSPLEQFLADLAAVQEGGKVTLVGDVVLTEMVEITKAITLDFAGYTISIASGDIINFKTDDNTKTLLIANTPANYTPSMTLTLGKIKIASGKSITVNPGVNDKDVTGSVTESTIYGYTTYSISYAASKTAIETLQAAVDAAAADATVSYTADVVGCLTVSTDNNLTLDLNGMAHAAVTTNIVHSGSGILTLTNTGKHGRMTDISGTISVTGGTVILTNIVFGSFSACADCAAGATLRVISGTYYNHLESDVFTGSGTIVIEGGTFMPAPNEDYLAKGKKLVESSAVSGAYDVVDDPDAQQYPDFINTTEKQGKYVSWATANNVTNPADAIEAAFLLNCANTEAAIAADTAAFKITSIAVSETGVEVNAPTTNLAEKPYNGTVTIKGKATLDAETWADQTEGHHFFKAELK